MLDPNIRSTAWPGDNEARILEFFKGKTDGFFADIGCLNGFDLSNTRALWQMGWSGVMVEADSRAFRELEENYGPHPERLRLLHAAIGLTVGWVDFYEYLPYPTFSTLDERWVKELGRNKFRLRGVRGYRIGMIGLPKKFDLLKIDCEGLDSAILESMPFDMQPSLVISEVNKDDGSKRIALEMERRGYHLAWQEGLDIAYAL